MLRPLRLALLALPAFGIALSLAADSPADPTRMSPCDREGFAADPPTFGNCYDCHQDRTVNGASGAFQLSGVPTNYTPGATYRLIGSLQETGQARWGFRITAIDAQLQSSGSFRTVDNNTENCFFRGRDYIRQTGVGSRPGFPDGPVTWEMDWTAPPAGSGTVRFYAVGLSCNHDSAETGDTTYTLATASAEAGAGGSGFSLLLQPDVAHVDPGEDLVVRARIVNHAANSQSAFLVTKIKLGPNKFFPKNGWLFGPTQVSLLSAEQQDLELRHAIPPTAPPLNAQYQAFLGLPPNTVLESDAFVFRVN